MFGGRIGFGELVVVLIIVLLIFGAGKLPQIGEGLGRAISNFKKESGGADPSGKKDNKEENK